MYFESAGISVSLWLPPLVALAISMFTAMGGVSGAFLLLPFQMSFLGYTAPSVSSTNHLFNVVAIPSGVYRYVREGRMVWPLTWMVVAGTLPGVLLGAIVRVRYLPDPNDFKLFAALVLLYIGCRMARDLTRRSDLVEEHPKQRLHESERQHRRMSQRLDDASRTRVISFTLTHLDYEFRGDRYRVSSVAVFVLCLVVGAIGGIYGIGGGSIVAPFFVSVFRLPVHTVAGAALMGTFVTSVAGVAFYQGIAPFHADVSVAPDWKLGILFGIGGAVGMYLGARCQKLVPARIIKWMLAGVVVSTAVRYLWAFVTSFHT
jgi:uncharacterized membrane protein YfcA